VGHIGPFMPFLKKKADSLVVVDDNPGLEIGIMGAGHTVSRDVRDLKDADIVIITGSSAAVGGFDAALDAAESARFIGVVGPSAGWLPQPAFRRGVHAVAATKITDLAGARRTILEGGGTPQFIKFGRKYTLIPR
ncbi:MAG: Rossmann-like domain-containing protein, partial [Desulfotignum sp.]